MRSVSEIIEAMRKKARDDGAKAEEQTSLLAKINSLSIYENASVHLPPDKTNRLHEMIERALDNDKDQSEAPEST